MASVETTAQQKSIIVSAISQRVTFFLFLEILVPSCWETYCTQYSSYFVVHSIFNPFHHSIANALNRLPTTP